MILWIFFKNSSIFFSVDGTFVAFSIIVFAVLKCVLRHSYTLLIATITTFIHNKDNT